MASKLYESLPEKMQKLIVEATEKLAPCHDHETGMNAFSIYGHGIPNDRSTLYYVLGLLLLDAPDCGPITEKACNAVIDKQFVAPDEIFHGSYRQNNRGVPASGVLDYKRLGIYGRYFTDVFFETTMNAFRLKLKADPELAKDAGKIEQLLGQSVMEEFPVVYSGYEPCSREFNLMCFAMILEHFSDKLSAACVKRIEESCRIAVDGAMTRNVTDFSPMNTNILTMHIFIADYFGQRLGVKSYCEYALREAERMLEDYQELHAAWEYNSPTYCGVDLSTYGYWIRYGSNERLKEIGVQLEDGIWHDMMDFWNPAMRNFCGPYSRAYELEATIHTAFPTLMYLLLDDQPYPPFSNESSSNALLAFAPLTMPEDCKKAAVTPRPDTLLRRQFHELAERGDPDDRRSLCTLTSWITPDLMVGAMSGSKNPSHQLHPYVVFWRGEKGLGTVKLLRCTPEGKMNHLHYVYFNGTADEKQTVMEIRSAVKRDIVFFYEIEYPGIAGDCTVTADTWSLPGLTMHVTADAPAPTLQVMNENIVRVCYLSEALKPETKTMKFTLVPELKK